MSYNANIPNAGDLLSVSQGNLKDNFQQLNTSFGIDHLPFTDSSPSLGFHKVVHLVNNVVDPAAVGLTGEVYCKQITSINTDEALFYQSGGGRIIQMTMNQVPQGATNGYSFLPGGILVQWGKVTSAGSSGTVTFSSANIAFPNNLFNVQLTLLRNSGNQTVAVDSTATFNKTKFSYLSSSSGSDLLWIAIGN